jgi:sugar-specific transcriptional regulator TrmB
MALSAASLPAAPSWIRAEAMVSQSGEAAAYVISRAGQEVVVETDVLRSREVAEAIRASLRRGVRVLILTVPQGLQDADGYLLSLAMAGAEVRVGSVTSRTAVVDGRFVVSGPHLAGIRAEDITLVLSSPEVAGRARGVLVRAWEKGVKP